MYSIPAVAQQRDNPARFADVTRWRGTFSIIVTDNRVERGGNFVTTKRLTAKTEAHFKLHDKSFFPELKKVKWDGGSTTGTGSRNEESITRYSDGKGDKIEVFGRGSLINQAEPTGGTLYIDLRKQTYVYSPGILAIRGRMVTTNSDGGALGAIQTDVEVSVPGVFQDDISEPMIPLPASGLRLSGSRKFVFSEAFGRTSGDMTWDIEPDDGPANAEPAVDHSSDKRVCGSRAWRNKNPSNMTAPRKKFAGSFAQKNGAIGVDDAGFAIFPDEKTGRDAQEALFKTQLYHDKTIGEAIRLWSTTDQDIYVKNVTKAVGVSAATKISDLTSQQLNKLMDAQKAQEGWKPCTDIPIP